MITRKHLASAVVLGLNDAIVEITGSLAGLTFALASAKLIGISGLVIGIAAALSMMASEFLSEQEDGEDGKESRYLAYLTGLTYISVVILLVIPYFMFSNVWYALLAMLLVAIGMIFFYSFHMAKLKEGSLGKRFWKMTIISMSVAFISFIIGYLLEAIFGIRV